MHSYTYDAENRITQVDSGGTATYVYDAQGRRVRKTVSGASVDYLCDLAGHVITEVNSSGGWSRGEVFAGGKHIATYNNSTTYFTHADWIGTERARTGVSGNVVETCTGLPFGDWQSCSGGDVSPLHFTGKQRDTETGLDDFNARYYASTAGRFMSPDWSAKLQGVPYAQLADPQSLNLYVYVRDNPITGLDLDGHGQAPRNMGCQEDATCKPQGESSDSGNASSPAPPKPAQQQNMSLSSKGLAFIEQHEGYSSTVYKDSAGNPTIGYGHLIQKGEDFSKGITKDHASALLAGDVKSAVGAVNGDLKVAVSQTKFDALVDFTYNLGGKNFANSTLLSDINAGKAVIESNFTSYNHVGGKVVPGLTIRRTDEFNLFSRGDYGGP